MFKQLKYKWKHDQKGATILMMASALSALMFTGGVVVDLGSYYSHASRLQNAADSAAAAGAAVYVDNKGVTRLVPSMNNIDEDGNFTYNLDGQTLKFKPSDYDKDSADERAAFFVSENNISTSADKMSTKLWVDESSKTTATGSTVSYKNAYAYRVELDDVVDLHFSKLFGLDSYPIKATSMAMFVIEPDPETIDDFVKDVNANIFNTIPNYYWESLYYTNKFNVTTTETENGTATSHTSVETGVGKRKASYFIDAYNSYIKDIATTTSLNKYDCPLAYAETGSGYKNMNIYDYTSNAYTTILADGDFCAEPIVGTNNRGLYVLTYTLNNALMQKAENQKEITGIFMDFPNTGTQQNARALKMNITGENLGSKSNPLYVRFESEPRIVGSGLGVTLVHPIIIDVKAKQDRPLVLAYDGPDPNRKEVDAPRVNTANGNATVGANSKDGLSNGSLAAGWVKTSTTTPAPFMVNLDADFNGVIYAPYSTVYITGTGKVKGFIMAASIIDNGSGSGERTRLTSHPISLPTWGATYKHNNGLGYAKLVEGKTYYYDSEFNYTTKYITGTYEVVYDEFHNFTNTSAL